MAEMLEQLRAEMHAQELHVPIPYCTTSGIEHRDEGYDGHVCVSDLSYVDDATYVAEVPCASMLIDAVTRLGHALHR
eukprot:5276936-Alexandrium_andersonii.AAC.1